MDLLGTETISLRPLPILLVVLLEQLLFSGAIRAAVIPNRDQRVKTSFGTLLALLFSVPLVRSLLVPL